MPEEVMTKMREGGWKSVSSPLDLWEILEVVFSQLSIAELKECRMVSGQWNGMAALALSRRPNLHRRQKTNVVVCGVTFLFGTLVKLWTVSRHVAVVVCRTPADCCLMYYKRQVHLETMSKRNSSISDLKCIVDKIESASIVVGFTRRTRELHGRICNVFEPVNENFWIPGQQNGTEAEIVERAKKLISQVEEMTR